MLGGWGPVLDGKNGIIPDLPSRLWAQGHYAKLPFISGTNLDEGTLFTAQSISTNDQILQSMTAIFTPSPEAFNSTAAVISKILALYPDNPAAGSPYGTGNETFGLSPAYKRYASLSGDIFFQALRRAWIQTATKAGIQTYGYLFSDPRATVPLVINPPPAQGSLGVPHASEIAFVYGGPQDNSAANTLSERMTNYWLSFATSLTPNDGKGVDRPNWPRYTIANQNLLQLNGDDTKVIPDSYRAEQLAAIIKQSGVLSR
jgi:carboxylesterase type B